MQEFTEKIRTHLKKDIEGIEKKKAEIKALEDKKASGLYSDKEIGQNISPRIEALKREIKEDSAKSIKAAKAICGEYQEELRKADFIKPEELTADKELLNGSIKLNKNDIEGILERNRGNKTMEQLTLRYCEEHGIETGLVFTGNSENINKVGELSNALDYCEKWLAADNGEAVIDRMLGGEAVSTF